MNLLKVHPADNLLVALRDLAAGELVEWQGNLYEIIVHTPAKHKFSTTDLKPGDEVIMYGVVIGKAVRPIRKGEVVTTFNVKHAASTPELRKVDFHWSPPLVTKWKDKTFMGYHRSDGKVGVANYWLVIPLVFCENRNIEMIRETLVEKLGYHKPRSYQLDVDKLIS